MRIRRKQFPQPWLIGGLCALILFGILFLVPVPYYIAQPGSALEVRPMIQVEKAQQQEKGTFLMTTVAMREGNIWSYLVTKVNRDYELIPAENVLRQGEDPVEYQHRQLEFMQESQQDAVIAAYKQADKTVIETHEGVEVFRLIEKMPASKVLKKGDRIIKVNNHQIRTSQDLIQFLRDKKPGEQVELQVVRSGKRLVKKMELASLPLSGGKQAGVGIEPITVRRITTDPKVTINAEDIGGPSAGLMFSLEIINQLTNRDLTRGLRVAGTGTITTEGQVGQIGGVQHKVVAADREEADLFFVPADRSLRDKNEKLAKETAKRIQTDMKIIPVRTLEEAIRYLEKQSMEKKAS